PSPTRRSSDLQTDLLQRLKLLGNSTFAFEKLHGFINGQVQYIRNAFVFILHIQDLLLKALSFTRLTCKENIGHKLHFDLFRTFPLTSFTASPIYIKAKERRLIAPLLRHT